MREIRTHVGTPSSVATLVRGSSGDMPISSSAQMKKGGRVLAEISPWKTSITTASPSVRFTKERKTSPPFPTLGQELVTSTCNRLTSARLPVIGSQRRENSNLSPSARQDFASQRNPPRFARRLICMGFWAKRKRIYQSKYGSSRFV